MDTSHQSKLEQFILEKQQKFQRKLKNYSKPFKRMFTKSKLNLIIGVQGYHTEIKSIKHIRKTDRVSLCYLNICLNTFGMLKIHFVYSLYVCVIVSRFHV